ncbi:MAG: phage minor tail protein, partial [Bacillus sp. (in: firmicutes)]|nr:phage minor tail protein [Bacillus sp. (in: firmicutes)]
GYNTLNDLTGGRLGDMLDKVKSIGGKIVDYFKKLPHRMASGIKNGWDAIKQAFVDLGNGMLSGIGKGVNGVIGGINWVLGKVHAPKIKKWDVPQYAKGGSAQGLAIVGEKGKHELIKHPDGRIEVSPNKATLYNFKQPVRILGGDKTESLMKAGIIPQFGVGNWLGSAMDFVKGGFSAISKGANSFWNAVTHPSQLLATAVDKFTDLSGLSGTIADMAKGTVTYATKEALNWIKEKLTLADEPGGSGVERWRPYVIRALSMNDLSTSGSMVSKVLRQIATESGGNPHAVQHGYTDVNTLSGDLAKGLMQTISATFNAYKFSGHGNIFSGFDNLLAALNYAKHRYGPSLSALGKGHGYANGAIVSTEQYAHIAEGNKPEAIIPLTNTNRAIQLMYQVLDYLSGDSSRSENGNDKNNDNSALISLIGQLINKSERTNQLLELIAQKNTTIKLNSRVLAEAVNREFTKQVRDDAIMG